MEHNFCTQLKNFYFDSFHVLTGDSYYIQPVVVRNDNYLADPGP